LSLAPHILSAVFSDESPVYRYPSEPDSGDSVTIRLRTAKDSAERIILLFESLNVGSLMVKTSSDDYFDYYEAGIVCDGTEVVYRFLIDCPGGIRIAYDKNGCRFTEDGSVPEFNIAYAFRFMPGFHVPAWAKGAVQYQIFTDRFYNGDPSNDVTDNEYYYTIGHAKHVENWDAYPTDTDIRCFYGGDLQGIMAKLDYLQSLGVEVLYLNPIFVSPSSHKYDVQDYDHIDPHFGIITDDIDHEMQLWEKHNGYAPKYIRRVTSMENLEKSDEYFARLCAELHARGMRIILDGVFNHCGSFNKWMDREGIYRAGNDTRKEEKDYAPGAYGELKSPYRDRFIFDGNSTTDYVGWWRHDTLPKLNYEHSEELCREIMEVAAKWISPPYGADGWRLDVAADLGTSDRFNHRFWQRFRKAVKEENPDALILAEHYGDAEPWLNGEEWDAVMNYDAFMEPVSFFLTGMEKHSDEYDGALHGNGRLFFMRLMQAMSRLPHQALSASINQLSNHDHSRFLTRTNSRVGRLETAGSRAAEEGVSFPLFRLGVLMQFSLPGAPALYYGDESGTPGWTDPDNRRTFPWGRENWDLISFHKDLIHLYKRSSCLRHGSFKPLIGEDGIVSYGRFDESMAAVIVINQSRQERTVYVPVWQLDIPDGAMMKRVMETAAYGYNIGVLEWKVSDGMLPLHLQPECGMILMYRY